MKIQKEELRKIADTLKIELSEEEVNIIEDSIDKITDKLDEIFKEEVENEKQIRTLAQTEYKIDNSKNKNIDNVDMNKLNNFDGEYISIEKIGENNE